MITSQDLRSFSALHRHSLTLSTASQAGWALRSSPPNGAIPSITRVVAHGVGVAPAVQGSSAEQSPKEHFWAPQFTPRAAVGFSLHVINPTAPPPIPPAHNRQVSSSCAWTRRQAVLKRRRKARPVPGTPLHRGFPAAAPSSLRGLQHISLPEAAASAGSRR